MTRRLPALVLAALVVLAGCGGGGSDRVVASGMPATVSDDALAAAGYEAVGQTERTINATVRAELSGDVQLNAEQAVTATTPVATYQRQTETGPVVVAVLAAPAVRPVENQPVVRNPLSAVDTEQLVAHAQSTYAVAALTETDTAEVALLGNETTMQYHEGEGTRDGDGTTVTVGVASVRDGDEFVTVVVVGPAGSVDRERLARLLGGVEH